MCLLTLEGGGGGSSRTISSKTYHLVAAILQVLLFKESVMKWSVVGTSSRPGGSWVCMWFTLLLLLRIWSCSSLSAVFHGRIWWKSSSKFSIFPKVCRPLPAQILLIQPLILLNHYVVGNVGIHPYQIKCMEHYWNSNVPVLKIMAVISNQLV